MNIATYTLKLIKFENDSVNTSYLEDIESDLDRNVISESDAYQRIEAFLKGLSSVKAIDSYAIFEEIARFKNH